MASVHGNARLPAIDSENIYLGTGQAYKIGYKKRHYTFLPPPHGTCTTRIPAAMQMTYEQLQAGDYDYDESFCYELCGQTFL